MTAACFAIKYSGIQSSSLYASVNHVNLRDALLSMNDAGDFIFDDVEITRNAINTDKGLAWTVNFLGSTHFSGTEIQGDMPKLEAVPLGVCDVSGTSLDVFDVTHGVQQATSAVSGKQEVQSVTIEAAADLAGFFPPHHTH
jgi:hypothetical protein